ncbi:hypothetical protein GW17_00024763 [Ensete ventricosum]|nr:hypothetical protein GW17_00024763 [Ensete ventricosum]RZR80981.1 hypothetical protein BHM03_00007119 [Ensete ventricosum]
MSMSRVVSALLPYDLFGSPRFDGDCVAPDDAIHRASPPIIVHYSWMSGVPSRAQSADHASGGFPRFSESMGKGPSVSSSSVGVIRMLAWSYVTRLSVDPKSAGGMVGTELA